MNTELPTLIGSDKDIRRATAIRNKWFVGGRPPWVTDLHFYNESNARWWMIQDRKKNRQLKRDAYSKYDGVLCRWDD